jgi:hypothetical protein
MIDLLSVLKRVSSLDIEAMYAEPFSAPYARFKGITGDRLVDERQAITQAAENPKAINVERLTEAVKLLFLVSYSREVIGMSGYIEEITDERDREVAGIVEAAWEENYAPEIGDLESLIQQMGQKVSNADRYPDAEWLDVVKPIGSVGGSTMFLVGWEVPKTNEYPLVAVDRGESLWATPLWELQGHSQDKIVITEEF